MRQLAHEYRARGVSAIVLTNRWPRSLPTYEDYEGIPTYRLAMRVPEGNLKARLNYQLTHQSIRGEMLQILKRHKTEVLHVQCVSSNGYYALLARRALQLPLVVTTQGERTMDAAQLYQHSAFMNRVLRELLAEADFITACSRNTLTDIEQYWGKAFGERARVVYNGIQTGDFAHGDPFTHSRPYVLGLGRLVAQKGFDVLIRAFAQAALPAHDLLLAGEGSERAALESLASDLGLSQRVRFIGRADRALAVALFKGCDFFVLPSRQEPFGIVNLEAMAAGKAVVAMRVGGVPEIVQDEQTGMLIPPEDSEALARAITRMVLNPELREQFGAAGRERVQKFTWPAIAEQYLDVYRSIYSHSMDMDSQARQRQQT